jgi:polyphosphate kinase
MFVISEIFPQHGGSLAVAEQMILQSKLAGADAIKVQLYTATQFGAERAYLELSKDGLKRLRDYANTIGIPLFATPFTMDRLDWCLELDLPYLKVAARMHKEFPELTAAIMSHKKPTFVSIPSDTNPDEIEKHDRFLSYPYQSFDYIIRLLREAAIDPTVFGIHISLYRLAENSSIAEALINAVHNGKHVVVVMELRARFMEEHNIGWAQKLKDEGAQVIYGVPNFKVHSKLIVISRRKNFKTSYITHIGTGNLNEDTAKLYGDFSLLTSRKRIGNECMKVFDMIQNFKPEKYTFNTLWVSPVNTRSRFEQLLQREIRNAKKGLPARAIIKVNSLVDEKAILSIKKAANAGVKIQLIVRGMCCLPIDSKDENITAISIIDKYLEHARVYYFENNGNPEVFIGSADLMQRNIEYRVEVTTPVVEKRYRDLLIEMLELQLTDNVKARILDSKMRNSFCPKEDDAEPVRSQEKMYNLVKG